MSEDDDMFDESNEPTEPLSRRRATQAQGNPPVLPPIPSSPIPPTQMVHANSACDHASPGRIARRQISRRELLGVTAIGLAGLGAAASGVGLEQWWQHGGLKHLFHGPVVGNMQIGHLMRRAGFGTSPDDLVNYNGLGFNGAVDQLLNYQQVSEDDTENKLNALNLDLTKPQDQIRWWLLRMAWTQRPLLEKMTLFWHGVLTSSFRKVGGPRAFIRMINQNQFLRAHAFDTFDNILLGITSDPAMLFYLDLTKSRRTAPNENYARELMELFTLGLGHYTQQDVYEGASALTGWHIQGVSSSVYLPQDHNDLTKTYLGHTGNLDYKDVISILANHPATPWFITRKLFTFLVYENPSVGDLQPLVDTYVKSGHNMGAVMRSLLLSPQFSSQKAYRARIKSPVEFAVGAYRALGVQGNGGSLPYLTTLMGQTVFDPPNVAGWPGDKVSALWLNSGTWMTRLNYIDALLVRGLAQGGASPQPIDLQGIINASNINSPESFVNYFAAFLLDGQLDSDRRTQLLDYFTTKDSSRGGAQISLTNGQSYPLNRVRGTLYLLMAAPEYQLN